MRRAVASKRPAKKKLSRPSADKPTGRGGRAYHVGVSKGDVAESIALVGDPARAEKVAARFDRIVRGPIEHREYVTITGVRKGRPITVCATGMGCDNTEIAVVELLSCVRRADFIRIGSCGALQEDARLGDLVVTTGAMRLEATSLGFARAEYPAIAHHEVVLALIGAAEREKARYRVGVTATTAGFYGWQARKGGAFAPREPNLDRELRALGVENFEMEASALLVLAGLKGLRAGCVCAVFAERAKGRFIGDDEKDEAENRAIDVGLSAFDVLYEMDKKRGSKPRFHP
jgi:uridine phosphorylase